MPSDTTPTFEQLLKAYEEGDLKLEPPRSDEDRRQSVMLAFRLDPGFANEVKAHAERLGMTFSAYVRRALSDLLAKDSEDESIAS